MFAKSLMETEQGHHLEKIGVSKQDMDLFRGHSKDHKSCAVPGKEQRCVIKQRCITYGPVS